MGVDVIVECGERKVRHERYRVAAAKFGTVREHVTVNEDADRTGAYVEVLVWIPRADIEAC